MPATKVWPFIDMTLPPNPVQPSVRTCGLTASQKRQRNSERERLVTLRATLDLPSSRPLALACYRFLFLRRRKNKRVGVCPSSICQTRGTHCRGEALP